jgi:hypothetical protein
MTTIYVTDQNNQQYELALDISSTYSLYIAPGKTGTWNWVAERYPYKRQSSSFIPGSGGELSLSPSWVNDTSVTQINRAVVQAYTTINNYDQLYDYAKFYLTQHPENEFVTALGSVLYFTCNLNLQSNATEVMLFNVQSNTLTIKASILAQGLNNTQLNTTGGITLGANTSITGLYQDSTGLSSRIILNNLSNTSIYIQSNEGAKYLFMSGVAGTHSVYLDPLKVGSWKWILERYPYKRQSGNIDITDGGDYVINPTWLVDSSVTEQIAANVAAYVDLGTAPKVNDYEAYWRTTLDGITYDDTLNRNGDTIEWTPYNVGIDPLASTPYSILANKITVKASDLIANTITTTGSVSYENGGKITGVVTDTTGVTSQITISGLTGCTVAIIKNTGEFFDIKENVTGVYTIVVPSNKTGVWRGVVTKFKRKYQEFNFTLGSPLPTTVSYLELIDDRVVAQISSIPQAYQEISSTQGMYDYFSWWSTTPQGVAWYKAVSWQGLVLSAGAANIQLNPQATAIASMDPVTHLVTIKSTILSGDITTTGAVTRVNGATTTGIVTDSTGTTAVVTYTGFTNINQLYVEDANGLERLFTSVTTDSFTLYLLPSQQTAHPWKWAAKKKGYGHVNGILNVSGAGNIPVQVGMNITYRGDGSLMYTSAATPSGLSADWVTSTNGTPRIKLGNMAYSVQDVYNVVENSLVSKDALKWLANNHAGVSIEILPAGNFIFLTQGWRFMQSSVGNNSATLNGFAQSSDGLSVDDINGPVSLLSSSGALSDSDLLLLRQTHAWLGEVRGTGFVKDVHSLTNLESIGQSIDGNTA